MREGTRVRFQPSPVSLALYSYPVPLPGTLGTVRPLFSAGGLRTSLPGPGFGLVYVEWDDGLFIGVSRRDVTIIGSRRRRA